MTTATALMAFNMDGVMEVFRYKHQPNALAPMRRPPFQVTLTTYLWWDNLMNHYIYK